MTCVVAMVDVDGNIHMASDSSASDGHSQVSIKSPKIFQVGEILIGYSNSFRAAQVLEYDFSPTPRTELQEDMEYLCSYFVHDIREAFISAGACDREANGCDCDLIIGYRGNIYQLQNDFSILHITDNFLSIGAGSEAANAVLHAIKDMGIKTENMLRLALETTSYYITSVRAPYHFVTLLDDGDVSGLDEID